jgi:hypothetical protein
MTDVAYLCHNCGSVHEVESIRQNLILDLRTAASYELYGQRGILGPRARFLRRRMTRGLARALWPEHSHHPPLAWGRRLVQRPQTCVSDRPLARANAAINGSDARGWRVIWDGLSRVSALHPRTNRAALRHAGNGGRPL